MGAETLLAGGGGALLIRQRCLCTGLKKGKSLSVTTHQPPEFLWQNKPFENRLCAGAARHKETVPKWQSRESAGIRLSPLSPMLCAWISPSPPGLSLLISCLFQPSGSSSTAIVCPTCVTSVLLEDVRLSD